MIEKQKIITLGKRDLEKVVECLRSAIQSDEDMINKLYIEGNTTLSDLVKKG